MADSAATPSPSPDVPFEIGLVMAGAISAGAYTAGVIDFLIQALDEWEKAKAQARKDLAEGKTTDCPMHEVRIKVLAGASAGGMTAGLAAGLLGMKFQSVTGLPPAGHRYEPTNNNLYRSWVNTIDIDPLLGVGDLAGPDAHARSLLDSTVLTQIAERAFAFEDPDARVERPYIADPLHVFLTVTNLRGVPYPVSFANYLKQPQYEMTMHGDYMHFMLGHASPAPGEAAFRLEPYNFADAASWGTLRESALATGAFPVGLAPRLLERAPAQYRDREWPVTGPKKVDGKTYCEWFETVPPAWPGDYGGKPGSVYDFLCVDGGVMNNEPLDLARRVMAGPLGASPREGDKAVRAVIMVMPFPNAAPFNLAYDPDASILPVLFSTFNSLIAQARFRPSEMVLADDPNVYSRFLIVPRRGFEDGKLRRYTIACGSLGGFGGFLSRRFREHDYQLGRRNCQWFLRQYFVLPSEGPKRNKLFDAWSDQAREKQKVRRAGVGESAANIPFEARPVLPYLPIIPLLGEAAREVPEVPWPTYTDAEFAALQPKIKNRLNRVASAMFNQYGGGFWTRRAFEAAWWMKRDDLFKQTFDAIRKDLTDRGLMK
jgi:hypothetical protein